MTRPLKVPTEDLRRHAGHLDLITDGLNMARRAGNATDPGPGSYGRLCLMVPIMLSQLQRPLLEAIEIASRSVQGNADLIIEAADLYEATDDAHANEIRHSGGGW
ncbi:type VII secretion target [Actinoplanes oblitus]|uniref:type VII secretion target n=1 Tax=Actinoplanes oblitus TaxID=3040509 RepID=UPI00389907CF